MTPQSHPGHGLTDVGHVAEGRRCPPRRSTGRVLAAAAAACVLGLLAFAFVVRGRPGGVPTRHEPLTAGRPEADLASDPDRRHMTGGDSLAVLTRAVGARWDANERPIGEGHDPPAVPPQVGRRVGPDRVLQRRLRDPRRARRPGADLARTGVLPAGQAQDAGPDARPRLHDRRPGRGRGGPRHRVRHPGRREGRRRGPRHRRRGRVARDGRPPGDPRRHDPEGRAGRELRLGRRDAGDRGRPGRVRRPRQAPATGGRGGSAAPPALAGATATP